MLRLDDLTVTTPTIRGAAIASSARWSYGLGKTGFIYMHNGTDSKFFDSVTFRDIGLPTLSPAQLAAIKVGPGISAPASTEAQAVALSVVSQTGASWGSPGYIYLAYFDTATNLVLPCLEPLGGGLYPAGTSSDQTLQMLGLPSSPVSTVVGLITATPAGFTGMRYGSYWWNSPSGNPVCAWTQ